jgi:drug/metabolite transporter (DMT)-like permease
MRNSKEDEGPLRFNEDLVTASIQEIPTSTTFLTNKMRLEIKVAALLLGVIISGACNRVASQVMAVSMNYYSFFIGLFNSIIYVVFYFSILLIRYLLKMVPGSDFEYVWKHKYPEKTLWAKISPWKYFVIMGLMDGLGNILGLIAQPYLTGPVVSLMSQTIVLFSVICAVIILRTTYSFWQLWAVGLLICGVMFTLLPTFDNRHQLTGQFSWAILVAMSTLPNAISFTFKELMFREKPGLDIFIVNSHGSLFQLLFQPIFLPITLLFPGVLGPSTNLLNFVHDGFGCFGGTTPHGDKKTCVNNPYPYLIYAGFNLIFNILLLMVTKDASALLSFMAIKAILPISVILFLVNWPIIGSSAISNYDIIGLIIIIIALGLYRFFTVQKNDNNLRCFSVRLPFLDSSRPSLS